ncbi:class I mannose-6-phosphate isomerase [Akkermansiaceae bacterium]|nr:class I mannose-6-phosphate isomerase [Akkermansiaceae bacterium]MDA7888142.1 class I mannose-6-phosphate isomerase [Akkermansiaceae bacterium]
MEPITFAPLYMTRVWGGRSLERVYHRQLPDGQPYGESWEMSDREEEQSIVNHGPFAGKSLHDLWTNHREELFGPGLTGERFPLLIKILDARDDLSIQVHPPVELAAELGGEAKTEMWYIADCDPGAKLYVGFKEGVNKEDFEASLHDGSVADKVHAIQPQKDQSIFIPSGRLHAIGAGFLIYEIQQNSDTTYRVFDWNRLGLDGKPRDLHVEQSLKSIDFSDVEPGMDQANGTTIASCEYFVIDQLEGETTISNPGQHFSIITVVHGTLTSPGGRVFKAGDFLLHPKDGSPLSASQDSKILRSTIPV